MHQRTLADLDAHLPGVRLSPVTDGPVELIVRRPVASAREVLDEAELDLVEGLVGDCWRERGSRSMPDGSAHPARQLTLMNARAVEAVAGGRDRWPLAGDQLYLDLDLSVGNLPPGTRLTVGSALIEVTEEPHTGCAKFVQRFGPDAMRWVNSPEGRELRLRGMNTRVVEPGRVRVGDRVQVVSPARPSDGAPARP
ncbi:MAG: MOSC domain-containing protein [Acidimicrobiales bacterium]